MDLVLTYRVECLLSSRIVCENLGAGCPIGDADAESLTRRVRTAKGIVKVRQSFIHSMLLQWLTSCLGRYNEGFVAGLEGKSK